MRQKAQSQTLDRTDFALVAALSNNARISNKELAAHVGLAPSTCLLRVRKLVDNGVISGFYAEVQPTAVGAGLEAMLLVRLSEHSADHVRHVMEHFHEQPETVTCVHMAGSVDFMIHVAVRDPAHLRELVVERVAGRSEIAHVETGLVFDVQRSTMPLYPED